jgi:hypothetical protein
MLAFGAKRASTISNSASLRGTNPAHHIGLQLRAKGYALNPYAFHGQSRHASRTKRFIRFVEMLDRKNNVCDSSLSHPSFDL